MRGVPVRADEDDLLGRSERAVERLMSALSEVYPPVAKWVEANRAEYGELLAYLVVGDLVDDVEAMSRRAVGGDEESGRVLERILAVLEAQIESADPKVDELIHTGFLEGLHVEGEGWDRIQACMGPRLRERHDSLWSPKWSKRWRYRMKRWPFR